MQKAGQTTKVEAAWAHYGALWRLHGLACPLPPSKENYWSVDALLHACPQPWAALGCPEQQTSMEMFEVDLPRHSEHLSAPQNSRLHRTG